MSGKEHPIAMVSASMVLQVFAFFSTLVSVDGEPPELPDCSEDLEHNAINETVRNLLGGDIIGAMEPDQRPAYNCYLEGYALYLFNEPYFIHRTFKNLNVTKLVHEEKQISSVEMFLRTAVDKWMEKFKEMGNDVEFGCQYSAEYKKNRVDYVFLNMTVKEDKCLQMICVSVKPKRIVDISSKINIIFLISVLCLSLLT